jgi:hypothetical protein
MTISLTRTVQRIETYPKQEPMPNPDGKEPEATYPTMMVVYNDVFDDPKDEQLPVTATNVLNFSKGDDVSKEDPLVVAICNALWK